MEAETTTTTSTTLSLHDEESPATAAVTTGDDDQAPLPTPAGGTESMPNLSMDTTNNTNSIENKEEAPVVSDTKEKEDELIQQRRTSLLAHPEMVQLKHNNTTENGEGASKHLGVTNRRGKRRSSIAAVGTRESIPKMTDDVRLATSQKHVDRAVMAVLYAVFVESMNLLCLHPNFPLMVTVGAHPDTFPSIQPFGPTSAQYLINGAGDIGAFLSGLTTGYLSDKYGRRRIMLVNLACLFLTTWAKYLARHRFWTFTAIEFVHGLFGSTMSVALGYMADIFVKDRKRADAYLGGVLAIMVFGRSCGGLLTVLFPNDLFKSLWVAAFMTLTGWMVAYKFVLEPKGLRETLGDVSEIIQEREALLNEEEEETSKPKDKQQEAEDSPKEIDKKTLFNIIFGAIMDNAGSRGLIPLALSPLMFNTYHGDFVAEGLEPIMREQTYRWLFSMIAVVAMPGAIIAPYCFDRYGAALSCVVANVLTGATTIGLLYIALINPPTTATFSIFTTILYISTPFCMVSQLSTGPMLDRITPLHKKGFVQGLNAAVIDGCAAVFPFMYALLADATNLTLTFWVATAVSLLAAVANAPLMFHPKLKLQKLDGEKPGEVDDDDITVSLLDEEGLQQKLERGDYVPTQHIWAVNVKRVAEGKPLMYTHPGKYTPGQQHDLPKEEYKYLRDLAEQRILALRENPQHKQEMVMALNALLYMDQERGDNTQDELGVWIKDYLLDNGYFAQELSPVLKAMIAKSFPRLSGSQVTVDNFEHRLIRIARLMNDYMEREGLTDDDNADLLGGLSKANRLRSS